jgi:type IV pilus assembly protein PilV
MAMCFYVRISSRRKPAHRRLARLRAQQGILLIEALIAILIFSLGILGMVGLQASAIKQSSEAAYRSIAAFKANDLVSLMWTSDRTAATLQANFGSGGSGTPYADWLATVQASGLPGVTSANSALPTVVFTTVAGGTGAPPSSRVVITIFWRMPGDAANRQYVMTSQLKP